MQLVELEITPEPSDDEREAILEALRRAEHDGEQPLEPLDDTDVDDQ